MSKQLSPLEKEFLVKRFLSNPDIKLTEFARANNISDTSLRKWVEIYKNEGIAGFIHLFQYPNFEQYGFVPFDIL